jgi:hypothetical protein
MGQKHTIRFNQENEVVFQVIDTNNNQVISTKTTEQMNLWKSKEFYILCKRTVTNYQTYKELSAFFIQKVLYRTPNRDGYDYHFFYYEKGFSVPCAKILDPRLNNLCGLTFQVSPSDDTFTKKVGAAKRLSNEQAKKVMFDKVFNGIPVLGIYEEDGSERV